MLRNEPSTVLLSVKSPASGADLPSRNGVGASCVALPGCGWPTVLDFLAARFTAISRAEWTARMTRGDVVDATGAALSPATPFRPHEKIFYYRSIAVEARIPFDEQILFQDDLIVAVDKPHFLPVTPAGAYVQETLLVRLKRRLEIDTLAPMHRLDRDTAGIVLFTIKPATRNRYQAMFREREIVKTYEAIAPWRGDLQFPLQYRSRLRESASFMQMEEIPGLPNAETGIDLIEVRGDLAKYCLRPATGQKHQLRLHMATLGMAIMHDRIYPHLLPLGSPTDAPDYSRPLQLLARSLRFEDPVTSEPRRFESIRSLLF